MNSTYLAYVSGMNFLKTETNLKLFLYFIFLLYCVCVHTCTHMQACLDIHMHKICMPAETRRMCWISKTLNYMWL